MEVGKDTTKIMKGIKKTFNQGKEDDRSSYYLDPFVDLRKVNDLSFACMAWVKQISSLFKGLIDVILG